MKSILRCLSFCFCDILCCQCNCIIFPAPAPSYSMDHYEVSSQTVIIKTLKFINDHETIPYIEIYTQSSRKNAKCFIYFHGNAQDIGLSTHFLVPLVQQLDITFYALEYPSYGCYETSCKALISNKIKEDSLFFYQFLKSKGRTQDDIYVLGRSIGSGGASYLAGHKNIPKLVLMSPFDTIKQVSKSLVGCLGYIVKQHFNNEQQIIKHNGQLLIIHGQIDEVINISHGKNLAQVYQRQNQYKNRCEALYPRRMSHNHFDMRLDIINPIKRFIKDSHQE